jgi:DNA-binding MarR family transcriptional regulator
MGSGKGTGLAQGHGRVQVAGSSADQVDREILDGVAEVFASLVARAEQVSQQFGVPIFFLKALHRLDCPLAMKDLGQRLRCDPSFVTGIADMLEKRGLATRESDPEDRRIKRICLTPAGMELRQQLEKEILPWRLTLDSEERTCLLDLLRKIVTATDARTTAMAVPQAAQMREEVSKVLVAPVTGADH